MKLQNPFTREEELKYWFELDPSYNNLMQSRYRENFKQDSNPIIMSIQNTITYFTKHAVLASLLLFISLGSVGTFAAELALPNELKPSTAIKNLFAANTQPDTDPYTRLVFDGQNDVVSLDRCDLAVKYPKKIKEDSFSPTYSPNMNPELPSISTLDFFPSSRPTDTNYAPNSSLKIDCYDANNQTAMKLSELNTPKFYNSEFRDQREKLDQEIVEPKATTAKNITKDQLREKYGWFITEADLKNIYVSTITTETPAYNYYVSETEKEQVDLGGGNFQAIPKTINQLVEPKEMITFNKDIVTFEYDSLLYQIQLTNTHPNKYEPVLAGNQIQLQFNSLVKNEANITISDAREPLKQDTSSNSLSSKTKTENALENANLDKSFSNLACNIGEITTYSADLGNRYLSFSVNKLDLIAKEESVFNKQINYSSDQSKDFAGRIKKELSNGFSQDQVTGSVSQSLFFSPQCSEESPNFVVVSYLGEVEYPNTDKAIAFVSMPAFPGGGGSSAFANMDFLTITVLATRGNDVIELKNFDDLKISDYITSSQIDMCESGLFEGGNIDITNPQYRFEKDPIIQSIKCVRDKHLWSNTKLTQTANQKVAELLQNFALKT